MDITSKSKARANDNKQRYLCFNGNIWLFFKLYYGCWMRKISLRLVADQMFIYCMGLFHHSSLFAWLVLWLFVFVFFVHPFLFMYSEALMVQLKPRALLQIRWCWRKMYRTNLIDQFLVMILWINMLQ